MAEFNTARSFDVRYNKNRLIMVLYEHIAAEEMREEVTNYIKNITFIARGTPFFCKRLMYCLAVNKLGPEEGNIPARGVMDAQNLQEQVEQQEEEGGNGDDGDDVDEGTHLLV